MGQYLKVLDKMLKENPKKESKKKEPIYDEDGKELKLTFQEFCQGILFLGSILGLAMCASLRGCQEYRKHHDAPKTVLKANVNSVTNTVSTNVLQKIR